ncbi:MAG: LPXTG cell wall anchor domain-containing protein [Massilioclostridium sp.]|nr:LPXTG cell wall anchor domain-containing protein [Massilioclostridium sp.]
MVKPLYHLGSRVLNFHLTLQSDYLFNEEKYYGEDWPQPSETVSTNVTFNAQSKGCRPYYLDLWTGEIIPATEYTVNEDGSITMPVTLEGNDTLAIAIAQDSWYIGSDLSNVYVTSSTNNSAQYRYDSEGNIVLRSTEYQAYSATLSNNESVSAAVTNLSGETVLDNWNLKLMSYEPGETSTDVNIVEVFNGYLGEATSWNTLEVLENAKDVSGIGTYTTTINWDSSKAEGAYLDLGKVYDLYTLYINDQEVYGADIVDTRIDIGDYLVDGENDIRIEVVSNLYNVLVAVGRITDNTTEGIPTEFGLTTGVSLISYDEQVIYTAYSGDNSSEDSSKDSSGTTPKTGVEDSLVFVAGSVLLLTGAGIVLFRRKRIR